MDDNRTPADPNRPAALPTAAQAFRHIWLTAITVVIATAPMLLLFDSILLIIFYQFHIAIGTRLIDAQWRRVGSSVVFQAQTLGQSLRLIVLSLAWPIALPMIRGSIDRHLVGAASTSEEAPPAN